MAHLEGILRHGQDEPVEQRTFAYYACHDSAVAGATGDVFYFVGKLQCADGAEARRMAGVALPIGFVGYVVITEGMGCTDDTVAVRGVFLDNRITGLDISGNPDFARNKG
jgi:hypothetical protein